jgi:ubiquitin-protein ligase
MESPDSGVVSEQKMFAIERLMRDFREIEENPLPTIIAQPLEDNIFNWVKHVTSYI